MNVAHTIILNVAYTIIFIILAPPVYMKWLEDIGEKLNLHETLVMKYYISPVIFKRSVFGGIEN